MISVEKSIYDPKASDDGLRILVMRFWPRGVKKEKVDLWLKDLGTSPELIRTWKSGKITWREFRSRYIAELKDESTRTILRDIVRRAKTKKVTLLCGCGDAKRCHRTILKQYIERIS